MKTLKSFALRLPTLAVLSLLLCLPHAPTGAQERSSLRTALVYHRTTSCTILVEAIRNAHSV